MSFVAEKSHEIENNDTFYSRWNIDFATSDWPWRSCSLCKLLSVRLLWTIRCWDCLVDFLDWKRKNFSLFILKKTLRYSAILARIYFAPPILLLKITAKGKRTVYEILLCRGWFFVPKLLNKLLCTKLEKSISKVVVKTDFVLHFSCVHYQKLIFKTVDKNLKKT